MIGANSAKAWRFQDFIFRDVVSESALMKVRHALSAPVVRSVVLLDKHLQEILSENSRHAEKWQA